MLHRRIMICEAELAGDTPMSEYGGLLTCTMATCVNNDVTGGVVWDGGHFLCVAEGSPDGLDSLAACAAREGRVKNVSILSDQPLSERRYQTWGIGRSRSPEEDSSFAGLLAARTVDAEAVNDHVATLLTTGLVAESPPLAGSRRPETLAGFRPA